MRIEEGFLEEALQKAKLSGAEEAEVYVRGGRSLAVEAKSGAVDAVDKSVSFGYGIRVIKSSRLGFAFCNDPASLQETVRQAIAAADFTAEDKSLGIPVSSGHVIHDLDGIYDQRVAEIPEAEAIKRALAIEASALAHDKRVTKVRKAKAKFTSAELRIANSHGLRAGYRSTYTDGSIMCVAEEGGDSQMGWGYQSGRGLGEVDFSEAGREAALRATNMLKAGRGKPSKTNIVLDNTVASEFLSEFASMLSAEAVQKGKSLLKGKTGKQIMSKAIEIIDDGLMPTAPGRRPIDDEGLSVYNKHLVSEGTLRGFMHNTQTGRREGINSTSNASRSGYSGLPYVGPNNIFISTSGKAVPITELFSQAGTGLYVLDAMGMHTVNPVSGEFSIGVSGLWIEGGKSAYPVKEMVISGNLLELFGRVEAVGSDLRFFGDVGSPSLLISGVDLSA